MSNSSCVLFNASLQLSTTTTRKNLITHLYHCLTRPVLEIGENQDLKRQLSPYDQPYPPPKLYECFPSPVLFTSYLPLCYSLYICSPCYLHQITPPPPMRYTSHFLICYLLHIFPLYCLLKIARSDWSQISWTWWKRWICLVWIYN